MVDLPWQEVFLHELDRRRKLRIKNPDLYKKVWMPNPKRIDLVAEDCKGHVWVPATHLMIHDSKANLKLYGVKRRAFREASPYEDEGYRIIPQICWYCDAHREHEQLIKSTQEQHEEYIAARPKKERKRRFTIDSTFEDLFSDLGAA